MICKSVTYKSSADATEIIMYSLFHVCVCITWFLLMCPFQISGQKAAKDILKEIAADSGRELTDSHLSEILACANDQTGCDKELQTVLNNEVKLRGSLYGLGHDCLRNSQEPPPDIDKSISDYIGWQERVIKRGNNKTHNVGNCNPFKSIRCTPFGGSNKSPRCACIRLKYIEHINFYERCTAQYGSPCSNNDKSKFYDPLSFTAGGTLAKNSTATPDVALCQPPNGLNSQETCRPLIYFNLAMCVNKNLTQKIEDLAKYFRSVTTLSLGQTCDHDEDMRLFTITDEEKMTMATRLQSMENLRDGGKSFCDTRQFLTCGVSNKCECKYPTLLEKASGKCVLQLQFNECDMKNGASDIDSERMLVVRARGDLRDAYRTLVKVCPGKMLCTQEILRKTFCNCGVPDKTGVNCDIQLAELMIPPRLGFLPMDAPSNEEKWTPFIELNNKLMDLSKKHSQKVGDLCNLEDDDALRSFVLSLRQLVQISTTTLTSADYTNLTQQILAFTNGAQKVCSQKSNAQGVFERCHHKTKKCFAAENQDKDVDYMISRFEKRRTLLCFKTSPDVTLGEYKLGDYLWSITQLEVLLFQKPEIQYCASGLRRVIIVGERGPYRSECQCDSTNCCERAQKGVEKLLGINNTTEESSVHSMHGPKNWFQKAASMSIILLTAFAELNY